MASLTRSLARPRVVITGLGVVSCLASNVDTFWRKLVNGQSGIKRLKLPELQNVPCKVGGEITVGTEEDQLNPEHMDEEVSDQLGPASMYGLAAARQALHDANWTPKEETAREYTGVAIGRISSDISAVAKAGMIIAQEGYENIHPYIATVTMCNGSAYAIGDKFGFTGPQSAPATACAAGTHAIIQGYQSILLGDAKVMVCGGADACMGLTWYGGYCRVGVLSTKYNETPELAARPFDKDRDGFVPADGAAVLVLEDLDHALSRGATIHAEMLGYGMGKDTGTITSPELSGLGIHNCMTRALRNSSLEAEDIGYVNAHATATKTGDPAEVKGIIRTFGPNSVYVVSNKGALGHMQGAAGAVEALSSILSCRDAVIPPTANLVNPEVEGVNYVMGTSTDWDREKRIVISNSFGFGCTCGSLVFSNFQG